MPEQMPVDKEVRISEGLRGNSAIIHDTRYRNSRIIDLGVGMKRGHHESAGKHSGKSFARKAIFRYIEPVKARRRKVRVRKSLLYEVEEARGNKSEIWRSL